MGCCSSCLHKVFVGGKSRGEHKENGLKKENTVIRGCTDPVFLFILLAAIGGTGFVTYWGTENGNTQRMLNGIDSWDNICGFDNRPRKTAFNCSSIDAANTCYSEQGCKWRGEYEICDPAGTSVNFEKCEKVTAGPFCYNDMIHSDNAGLDMTDRPSRYYTNPGSLSAAIICVASCPTSATVAAAGFSLSTLTNAVDCDPKDPFCQEFCLGDDTNPYGLYEANKNNTYMTSNEDRGNCHNDGIDGNSEACTLPEKGTMLTAATDIAADVTQIESLLNGGLDWLTGVGTDLAQLISPDSVLNDWDTGNGDWETCETAAFADLNDGTQTVAAAASKCPNTGCPNRIYGTYDLPESVRSIYMACLPSSSAAETAVVDALQGYLEDAAEVAGVNKIMTSVAAVYKIIGYTTGIAVAISYILIILMKFVIRPLIVSLMVISFLFIAAICGYLIHQSNQIEEQWDSDDFDTRLASDAMVRNKNFYTYGSRIWSVFTVVMFVLLIAMRNQIWIAATLYMEASKAMFSTPSMLISPIIHWFFVLGTFAAWLIVMVLITSVTDTEVQTNPIQGQGHVAYADKEHYNYFLWFHVFMGIWGLTFLNACHEFVLSGCITNWYKYEGNAPNFAYFRALWRLARNHLGTVALGSLIIAICQAIMLVLAYIERKAKEAGVDDGVAKFVLKAMMCCMWCLNKCLKYINRNAYIECNLYGYAFCNSAWEAFETLLKNFVQVAAHNFVGKLVFFTLKVLVISLNLLIASSMIKSQYEGSSTTLDGDGSSTAASVGSSGRSSSSGSGSESRDPTVVPSTDAGSTTTTTDDALNNIAMAAPMVLIALITYFVVSAFTELFEMTTDTILICFCEDKSHNDAKKGTLLAPESLQKALGLYKTNLKAAEENQALKDEGAAEEIALPYGAAASAGGEGKLTHNTSF